MPKRTSIQDPPPYDEQRVRKAIEEASELQTWLRAQVAGFCDLLPEGRGHERTKDPEDFQVWLLMGHVERIERMTDITHGFDGKATAATTVLHVINALDGKLRSDNPKRHEKGGFLEDVQRLKAYRHRGLRKIKDRDWLKAYRAWQGVRSQHGGDPSQRYSAAGVLFELLEPARITKATSATNFGDWLRPYLRLWFPEVMPPKRKRHRFGASTSKKRPPKKST